MHCKQWFAVVIQQVRANILAQLGSNPFQSHHGATADPTTPSMGSQNNRFLKKKNRYVLLCCPKIQRTGSWGQSLSTRSETSGLVAFFPFHILETIVKVLKGGKSAFLRLSVSNSHLFKYQQRGNFHRGSFPPLQFGKGQPLAYAKKGKHTFCIGDFCNSFTLDILSPILSTTQSQIRQHNTTQHNTEGICCPFLPVVEQSCDGTALMRSY